MFGRVLAPLALALSAGFFVLFLYAKPAAAAIPDGFEDGLVTDVVAPTALDFTPDGRMLVTGKLGQLHVYDQSGETLSSPALNLGAKICNDSERGLLGVAVDPDFGMAGNDYVYLYYTAQVGSTCNSRDDVNRVSRFTMNGDTVDPNSEEVLINNIPSPNGNHNAGDLKFGKDGYLYVSVGDGGCDYRNASRCQYENDAARDKSVLLGKILRISKDGNIPQDNPYVDSGVRCNETGRNNQGKHCQETYASGLRNPFRIAFDPDAADTSFRINEVGGQRWEEIDDGKKGADYGWNVCEGNHDNPYRSGSPSCTQAPLTGPIYEYSHGSGCESITGGAFVPDGVWAPEYDDSYIFADFVCGKIFELRPKSGGGFERRDFATGLGGRSAVAMDFGPYGTEQALYYTTFEGGGQVRRIFYAAGNRTPIADVEANPNYGESLTINLDGSGSNDPDGDTQLTYLWDFDSDGTTDQTTTSPETSVSHTYPSAGKYTATLTVRDGLGKESTPDTVEVFPGDAAQPEPTIETPAAAATFGVGEEITLRGSATDADEGGQPAESSLEWEVLQHHDSNHAHPLASGTGNNVTFPGPSPEGLYSTDPAQNYLEIRLTATDPQGLSKTITQELRPRTVEVSFATNLTGLRLTVNGQAFRAPKTFLSWEGYDLNVSAPRQKLRPKGRALVFVSWSDGGANNHTITTPADPDTYTATFRRTRR